MDNKSRLCGESRERDNALMHTSRYMDLFFSAVCRKATCYKQPRNKASHGGICEQVKCHQYVENLETGAGN
jgi:hypothetical protein